MELTIREVATLTGWSRRTIRARLARGELAGTKKNGRWVVQRDAIPLTAAQQRALQAKAERIRDAVEDVLPSRMARSTKERFRSVADMSAFRGGAEVLTTLRASDDAPPLAVSMLEEGLMALAEGHHLYAPLEKRAALQKARTRFARTVGYLLSADQERFRRLIQRLEGDILPSIGGLCRATERRMQR